MIRATRPGLFTTVQDAGRRGYQAFGMPVAGAMDRYACRVANLLAGNRRGAALLEMTMTGGAFEFETDGFVAICGADMQPSLDGAPVPGWSAFQVPAGSSLSFGTAVSGCRTYLAIRGGINVPLILGSRSTYTRAALGGVDGRHLMAGDILYINADAVRRALPVTLPGQFVPRFDPVGSLRVILGPQDDMFTAEGIWTFLNSEYRVSGEADRMGYRLEGPKIAHAGTAEIISDALPEGAVQVPAHGTPIVMMADRQTTGGYPKIATVIGPDLAVLAQKRPGDAVRFLSCSDGEAVAALRAVEERCHDIERLLEEHQAYSWTRC